MNDRWQNIGDSCILGCRTSRRGEPHFACDIHYRRTTNTKEKRGRLQIQRIQTDGQQEVIVITGVDRLEVHGGDL